MNKSLKYKYFALGLGCMMMSACSEHSDLQQWMSDVKAKAIKSYPEQEVPSINAMATYTPPANTGLHSFDSARLQAGNAINNANGPSGNRPKEVLEAFGLEKLEYVGSMVQAGKTIGFIRVDGHIYTIQNGNYLGQDFGKVTAIEPDRVVLNELVENTEGAWEHREGSIIRADTGK